MSEESGARRWRGMGVGIAIGGGVALGAVFVVSVLTGMQELRAEVAELRELSGIRAYATGSREGLADEAAAARVASVLARAEGANAVGCSPPDIPGASELTLRPGAGGSVGAVEWLGRAEAGG